MDKTLRLAMKGWRELNEVLMDMREDQVLEMLNIEVGSAHPRSTVIERLHQRYTILRAARERGELMAAIK